MAQLMSLPDWLLAPLQTENFIDALRLQVSEFASGEWLILYGGIKRFFLKDDSGYWEGTYHLGMSNLHRPVWNRRSFSTVSSLLHGLENLQLIGIQSSPIWFP